MKAAIINQFGGPEVFKIQDIDKPNIQPDQVLIKVKTVSINPIDWKQRNGNHKLILGSPFPIVLGYDVCGEVIEVGSEISRFKPGDLVYGVLDNKYGGALAEYAVGHENCFDIKPENIDHNEAAAFPMVALTALQALKYKSDLKTGQTVLINGASGGVGHLAVQLAKLLGAKVIAVASSKSEQFINQFNPDTFIDYTKQDILDLDRKVDIFFDVIGNQKFPKIKHLLTSQGIYLNLNYIDTMKKMPLYKLHQMFTKKKAKAILMKNTEEDLQVITKWIKEEKLKVSIDKTFSLEQIREAHEYAQQGHNKGKNIVVIN
ncbi:MAG: NADP-dependent oxidoreductase [Bacteroidetes bacterium]|nr:NADP-dependent oxidoreductase [Bacteroidota bacterium]